MRNYQNHYVISIKNVYAGAALKSQLRELLSSFLQRFIIYNIWKRIKACSRNRKVNKTCGGPKELSTNISAHLLLRDLREAYLTTRRTNY